MKYCTYMSALDIQSRTEVVVVLSKLPHLRIPEHHLCRAMHILSDNRYLAGAKGTVLLSIDQLMIDIQVQDIVVGDDSYQICLTQICMNT